MMTEEGLDGRAVETGRHHLRRSTKDQIIYKLSEIRHQMLDGATNSEIMSNLNIPQRTFYRYMRKIYEEDKLELAKENNKTLVTHIFLHRDRLLYTLQNCSSIATNSSYSVKDRIEAEKLKVDVSLDLLKLASEGPMMAQIKHYKDRQNNDDDNDADVQDLTNIHNTDFNSSRKDKKVMTI
jgi:DNA-binding CsgD family transcriptional regulator